MSKLLFFAIVHAIVAIGSCSLLGFLHPKTWNGLHASFGVNPLNTWYFDKLPRTVEDATSNDFKLYDSQCESNDQNFRGMRYNYKHDNSVLLLFDANGLIAGVQMRIFYTSMDDASLKLNKDRAYVKDGEYWTSTVYFVDPKKICNGGRTNAEFASQGTGTGLYIQNGTTPDDLFIPPMKEEDIKKTLWGSGKCFPLMGQHYWYNVRKDMKEEEFYPYCLLYNNGRLDAFCFASQMYYDGSGRFEHPTVMDAEKCCIDPPNFFKTYERVHYPLRQTTMHIYMTDSPRTSFC